MTGREKFIAEIPLREGAHAIYIERPTIAYVRVSEIRAFEDHMEAHVAVVPTPGMNECDLTQWKVGAAWEGLSNIDGLWHVRYVAFTVYFGQAEVQIGLDLAARAASEGRQVTLSEMRQPLERSFNKRVIGFGS